VDVETNYCTDVCPPCHEMTFCCLDHTEKWLDVALDNQYHKTLEEMKA
jgi:hypothetical protein